MRWPVLAAGIAGLWCAGPAQAEDDDEKDEAIEVVVRAPPQRSAPGQTQIKGADAGRTAGTQGDAAKAVQNLPSVARPAFGAGQLVVWGSAPEDTRVYIDGIEMPSLYHFGGVRSVVPSSVVRSVDLLPGGFGVEYGRALGGVARVETKALPEEGLHGVVAADVYDASVLVQAAFNARFRVSISARYSYVDRLLTAIVDPKFGDFYPLPRYQDAQLKLSLKVGEGKELSIVAMHTSDEIDRVVASADPTLQRSESTFELTERVALRYRAAEADGTTTTILPWFGVDRSSRALDFGGPAATLDLSGIHYGLRAEHVRPLVQRRANQSSWLPSVDLKLGVDALGIRTRAARSGSLTIPPREGDVVAFGQPPGDELATDNWTAHVLDIDPYAALVMSLGPITVTPGLRFNGTLIDDSRKAPPIGLTPPIGSTHFEPSLDPRLLVHVQVGERLAYDASVGLYHQPPDPRDLSSVFGTPRLGPSKAVHATLGQSARLTDKLTAEMVGFYKKLSDLPARVTSPTPPLASALSQGGEGSAFGANLLIREEPVYGFSGWLSYAISRSERWIIGREEHRLFDFDQTHLVTLCLNQSVAGFDFGLRFRIGSGMPRTPVVGAYYNARDDRYEPVFGDQSSIRLPFFYQLDLRAEKAFQAGPVKITVFADVQNVTNAANAEELAYSFDYGTKDYVTGLPVIAVAGASVEL